ncbi:MAG: hypothetical protein K0U12_01770, partial [Gammaproteobacteria bacterium]|nr:hypothetical protein [Gammaproteobacteria bacterium]
MNWELLVSNISFVVILIAINVFLIQRLLSNKAKSESSLDKELAIIQEKLQQTSQTHEQIQKLLTEQHKYQLEQRTSFDQHQISALKIIQESLQKGLNELGNQVNKTFKTSSDTLSQRVNELTQETSKKLKEISGEVDKQLATLLQRAV